MIIYLITVALSYLILLLCIRKIETVKTEEFWQNWHMMIHFEDLAHRKKWFLIFCLIPWGNILFALIYIIVLLFSKMKSTKLF